MKKLAIKINEILCKVQGYESFEISKSMETRDGGISWTIVYTVCINEVDNFSAATKFKLLEQIQLRYSPFN